MNSPFGVNSSAMAFGSRAFRALAIAASALVTVSAFLSGCLSAFLSGCLAAFLSGCLPGCLSSLGAPEQNSRTSRHEQSILHFVVMIRLLIWRKLTAKFL